MGSFDFEPAIESLRRRTGNKWRRYGRRAIPAWVADMDFPVAPVVDRAIREALDRGDLGYYGDRLGEVAVTFAAWQRSHHGWDPDPQWCMVVDDVVSALELCLEAYCEPGDGVIVPTPVYPPLVDAVVASRADLIDSPMRHAEGRWHLDLDHIEAEARSARVLVLCNPHNPTGRVFGEPELVALARIATEHGLIVVSDEIWADLTFAPHRHIPFASLGDDIAARTVTLGGPSKTFNIGGLRLAVAAFGSEELSTAARGTTRPGPGSSNALAVAATLAAWRDGEPWYAALRAKLEANRALVTTALSERLDHLDYRAPEATYLAWIGCDRLSLEEAPARHLLERHGLAVAPGIDFSTRTPGWIRLNFATGTTVLNLILDRLADGLDAR